MLQIYAYITDICTYYRYMHILQLYTYITTTYIHISQMVVSQNIGLLWYYNI